MNDNTRAYGATSEDAAAIERDILRTQDDMSRTVDKLGNQLTLKNIFNSLLDKADENGVDANYLVDGARRNPIALGLIAAGAIWLVSDKDSKFPSVSSGGRKSNNEDEFSGGGSDVHHQDYVAHMSSLQMRDGEDAGAYQRRRDIHRATFLMCERKPEEDEGSFRERLDDLTDKFRAKRSAWSDTVSRAGTSAAASMQQTASTAQQSASQAADRARDLYDANPLIGGILAAAIGAAVGSAIPISRQEQESLGALGAQARGMAAEQKDQLAAKAMETKDQLLDRAQETLHASSAPEHAHASPAQQLPTDQHEAGSKEPFTFSRPDG